jgi:hypothetical protein
LARGGVRVGLFARGRPRGLIVGESLVPAIIPILRDLGVEDEVRSYAVHKPGATFSLGDGRTVAFRFADTAGRIPGYAYNVLRDRFDATLLACCVRNGVTVFRETAHLARDPTHADRVRLDRSISAAARAFFGAGPDLIVDATGRAAALPRLLALPTRNGARTDRALFAHWEGLPLDNEGHVHMDRLTSGWCWRIPVTAGRVSLGTVVRPEALREIGTDAATQLDGFCRREPHLRRLTATARRVTPVAVFNNYQRTCVRAVGDGWALVGDALGFVDPIFSSGLFLAMDGAVALAQAVQTGTWAALARFEREQLRHHRAWRKLANSYYDGRLLQLVAASRPHGIGPMQRVLHTGVAKLLGRSLTGESTTSPSTQWLLHTLLGQVSSADRELLQIH